MADFHTPRLMSRQFGPRSTWLIGRSAWSTFRPAEKGREEDAAFREHVAHTYNRLDINAQFDRQCLEWLAAGDADSLCRLTFDEIEEKAGNGGHEIRNWIAMLGTVAGATGTVIAYEPVTEWICGMGQLVMSV